MPRQTETKVSRRTQLAGREVLQPTQIQARPTDPYVSQAKGDDLIKRTLDNAVSFLEQKGRFDVAKYGLDKQEGMLAAYRETNPDLDEDRKGFIDGYNQVEGELTLAGYKARLAETLAEGETLPWEDPVDDEGNAVLDPETGDEIQGMGNRLLALEEEFLGKLPKHRKALEAFAPGAYQAKLDAEEKFKLLKISEAKKDILSKQSARMDIMIGKTIEEKGNMRTMLSQSQEFASALGLSKSEIAEVFVHSIGRRAVEEGNPDLLDVFYEPDGSGISILNTEHAEQALQYIAKARASEAEVAKAESTLNKALEKERVQGLVNDMTARVLSIESGDSYKTPEGKVMAPSEVAAVLKANLVAGIDPVSGKPVRNLMSSSEFEGNIKYLENIIQDKGGADLTNYKVANSLRANLSRLHTEEQREEWLANFNAVSESYLSRTDAKAIYREYLEQTQNEDTTMENRLRDESYSTWKGHIDDVTLRSEAAQLDTTGFFTPDLNRINRMMMTDFQRRYVKLVRENKATFEEIETAGEASVAKYQDELTNLFTVMKAQISGKKGDSRGLR